MSVKQCIVDTVYGTPLVDVSRMVPGLLAGSPPVADPGQVNPEVFP